MSKKDKRKIKYVMLEYKVGDQYYGANYDKDDIDRLVESLRVARDKGIAVHSVYVDEKEIKL